MIYYTADLHLGHENIIRMDSRPFASAEEMDGALIERWNAVVGEEDTVYIVGDFCCRSSRDPMWYLRQLKGHKHLIVGNHDEKNLKNQAFCRAFESINQILCMRDGDRQIVLCHYPLAEWPHYFRGAWHIYGHVHGNKQGCYSFLKGEERALNAGCMLNGYQPVAFEELYRNNMEFNMEESLCK